MNRIGIFNTTEGRSILQKQLTEAAINPDNIISSFSDKYGNFVIKESLLVGRNGVLKIQSTWKVLSNGKLKFSTLIPKGGMK